MCSRCCRFVHRSHAHVSCCCACDLLHSRCCCFFGTGRMPMCLFVMLVACCTLVVDMCYTSCMPMCRGCALVMRYTFVVVTFYVGSMALLSFPTPSCMLACVCWLSCVPSLYVDRHVVSDVSLLLVVCCCVCCLYLLVGFVPAVCASTHSRYKTLCCVVCVLCALCDLRSRLFQVVGVACCCVCPPPWLPPKNGPGL